jgi:hypothetical protein
LNTEAIKLLWPDTNAFLFEANRFSILFHIFEICLEQFFMNLGNEEKNCSSFGSLILHFSAEPFLVIAQILYLKKMEISIHRIMGGGGGRGGTGGVIKIKLITSIWIQKN